MKKAFLLTIFISIIISANSQEALEWKIQYSGFFDNREYSSQYVKPQTIFGNRLDFSAGIRIDSVHSIQFGADYLYEFGSHANAIPLYPTVYYSYINKGFEFYFGAFPREKKINYPKLLLNDTLNYYRPNIEGLLIKYKGKHAYQNLWTDWVGRQTNTNNERFLAGTDGKLTFGKLFFENYLYMYHHAARAIRDSSFHLRDNGGGALLLGIDLSEQLFFKLSLGSAFSYDRYRPSPYQINKGLYGKLRFKYKKFILRLTHYQGENISLGYGDQLYNSNKYTRIDGEIGFFKHKSISCLFQYSIHLFNKEVNSSQLLMLKVNINGKRNLPLNK